MLGVDEVDDELMVSLGPGQTRVYDPGDPRPPPERRLGDLAQHAPLHLRVADDALPHLGAARLELRLHEHERLPAGRREPQRRRQRRRAPR